MWLRLPAGSLQTASSAACNGLEIIERKARNFAGLGNGMEVLVFELGLIEAKRTMSKRPNRTRHAKAFDPQIFIHSPKRQQ
jgi:hypothetical protein